MNSSILSFVFVFLSSFPSQRVCVCAVAAAHGNSLVRTDSSGIAANPAVSPSMSHTHAHSTVSRPDSNGASHARVMIRLLLQNALVRLHD